MFKLIMENKKLKIVLICSCLLVLVIFFRIYTNISSNKEKALRASQTNAILVETALVTRKNIVPTMAFSANLDPIWSAAISPKIDGRLANLYVDEGDYVTSGQIVAQMDVDELQAQVSQAQGSIHSALAQKNDATVQYERNLKLYKEDAISKKELDSSKYQQEIAIGNYTTAQGSLDLLSEKLSSATIRVPRDAVVTRRYLYDGYYVKSGEAIISIADTTSLLAIADIGEGLIADVYLGADVDVTVVAYHDEVFHGKVNRISPMASLPARTFKVEIKIPNTDNRLKAGMFSTIAIRGQERKDVIVVPQSAIVMREDQRTVYVVNSDNIVQQKLLETGAIDGDNIEVIKGLSEGERIVIGGQNKLRQGMKVSFEDDVVVEGNS